MLSEHTIINHLDTKVQTYYNIDTVILDLKKLRNIFKRYLNKQIIICHFFYSTISLYYNTIPCTLPYKSNNV